MKGVTEEGADYEEGKEEVGRQGRGREESVIGVPVEPLVGYLNFLFRQKIFKEKSFDIVYMFQRGVCKCEGSFAGVEGS